MKAKATLTSAPMLAEEAKQARVSVSPAEQSMSLLVSVRTSAHH